MKKFVFLSAFLFAAVSLSAKDVCNDNSVFFDKAIELQEENLDVVSRKVVVSRYDHSLEEADKVGISFKICVKFSEKLKLCLEFEV